jgi:mannose-6-phosphate isomerase-like protein (cupin superfamily)
MTDYRMQRDQDLQTHVEEPSVPPLTVVNLKREADSVEQVYKNFVLFNVNNHAIRMAVMEGEFRWHKHPRSDECFLVVEGELEIDIAGDKTYVLKAGDAFTIPAGVVHRTRSRSRAVNLCFEDHAAYTDVIFEEPRS